MKPNRTVATLGPAQGRVALKRALAMLPWGACGTAMQPSFATSDLPLDRHEDRVHPGEASA